MKIEYLTNTNPDHPKESILRIFDFDSTQACQFRDILAKLATGSASEIDISDLPFVTSIDGCRLILKAGMRDKGLNHVSSTTFECTLTRLTWENAEGLVEPFCEGNLSGYQWLYDLDNDIEFLFSPSGDW
jgi:hypothetical protein